LIAEIGRLSELAESCAWTPHRCGIAIGSLDTMIAAHAQRQQAVPITNITPRVWEGARPASGRLVRVITGVNPWFGELLWLHKLA
jgi:hypothetical protein